MEQCESEQECQRDEREHLGIGTVGRLWDGAAAVGYVVAEQPDVLLIADMLPGFGQCRWSTRCGASPHTRVFVQIADDDSIGRFLDAGAACVVHRRLPPTDVATEVGGVLTDTTG